MLPEIGLAKGACTLWEEELLFDYTIEVEDERFRVHKVVMASVSDYFKAMLTGGMVESREDKVRLEGLSSLAVKNMIEYIYTGQFGSSKASAEERLTCAVYLQIPAAVKMCTAALCEEVDKKNCFHILSIFKTYMIKHGMEHGVKFIKLNFEDILDNCSSEDLTHEEFLSLMDCWRKSECQLFVRVMQWLKKDPENRKEHLNAILSSMRFCLMSPTELALIESIKGMGIIADPDGPWHDLVEKALGYHKLPTHQKVLEESEQAKVRTEPSPVCFGLHPSLSGQLYAIREENLWTRYDAVNPPLFEDGGFELLVVNNFYIVCINNGKDDVQCFIFDPRSLTWSAIASMGIPREHCALVYHENHLYAIGGHDRRVADINAATDVIEKYDFHTNTWSVLTSKLPVAPMDVEAFSIDGCIYIPTGWFNAPRLHCFDPETDEWSEKAASPAIIGSNRVVVEIHGEKVIAYIDNELKLHYYKPSTDQWSVYDRSVPSRVKYDQSVPGNVPGKLHASGNVIFLIDYDELDGAEDFCEKWTFGEDGLQIDTVTDRPHPEWCGERVTVFCALLALP